MRSALLLLLAAAAATPSFAHQPARSISAIASHVIYSYPGLTVPSELLSLVNEGRVGGVILFGENVGNSTPAQMLSLQQSWKKSSHYDGLPLLIVTDQEGGEVARLPGGPTESEKEIGESADPPSEAASAGRTAAAALKAYYNNGNLAPVCDVFRTPGDFDDQFQRSYSSNATIAAECAAAFVPAQQGAGIVATLKHFPGLGAANASQNTDEVPVTLNVSLHDIRTIDEVPFRAAIAKGADMVMASWAVYPALDPEFPSGLSEKWIQHELRGRLGFCGVTITDAIEAGALVPFGLDDGYRGVLASRAGMDVILASQRNVTQGSVVLDGLIAALGNGTLDGGMFDEATERIARLRRGLYV